MKQASNQAWWTATDDDRRNLKRWLLKRQVCFKHKYNLKLIVLDICTKKSFQKKFRYKKWWHVSCCRVLFWCTKPYSITFSFKSRLDKASRRKSKHKSFSKQLVTEESDFSQTSEIRLEDGANEPHRCMETSVILQKQNNSRLRVTNSSQFGEKNRQFLDLSYMTPNLRMLSTAQLYSW